MKKYLVSTLPLLFLLLSSITHAQTNERYWDYRSRLDSQFLVIGESQGYSVPAAYRNPLTGIIKWSDATVDHGWYLGVLATEHYLLRESGQFSDYPNGTYDLEANKEALYYALKALERLDVQAETAFILCFGLPQFNGFFIRDDAPANLHTQFDGMSGVLSDYLSFNIYDKEMSQDQVYHLLLGLSLVSRCVEPDALFNGESLAAMAENLAKKIIKYVAVNSNWTIRNPVCDKVVDRGPDAWSLAYGTNEALKYITGAATEYDNQLVVQVNQAIWPSLGSGTNPIHINSDNTHMIMTLGAIGKLWNNSTLNKLMNLSNLQDFFLYPLLHVALYGAENVSTWADYSADLDNTISAMLEEAPDNGPASPQPLAGTNGWGSNNRFIRKKADHVNGSNGSIGNQYNGLDYMLLYNLYQMVYACPAVSFEPLPESPVCLLKTDIDLTPYGNPPGGIFSGTGVLANQFFNPSEAGPGEHQLTYTYSDGEGCINSATSTVTVAICTSTDFLVLDQNLSVFPNPSKTSLQITFSFAGDHDIAWSAIDVTGKMIQRADVQRYSAGEHRIQLPVADWDSGQYFIRFFVDGAQDRTLPVTVQ